MRRRGTTQAQRGTTIATSNEKKKMTVDIEGLCEEKEEKATERELYHVFNTFCTQWVVFHR